MWSISELCEDKKLQINQLLKVITNSVGAKLLLRISVRINGFSRIGFLPLEKAFEMQLEMATRHGKDLNVFAEIVFSQEIHMKDDLAYFKPSVRYPHNYCNILCGNEKVSIKDILIFKYGEDASEDVKAITVTITAEDLYVKDVDLLLNSVRDDIRLTAQSNRLPFGLTLGDVIESLDSTHPHFNIGIPLAIAQWRKNTNENKFDGTAKENKDNLDTTIQDFIKSNELKARPKEGIINAAAALSVSGSVTSGRKKDKIITT